LYTSKINIKIRDTILDPQGKAVEHSLKSLGFNSVTDTRIGKYIELKIDTLSEEDAKKITEETCRKLLANPVMEDYEFIVSKDGEGK